MSWEDTIQDDPSSNADSAPSAHQFLKVTVPTAENLANATEKPTKAPSWEDTIKEDPNAPNPFLESAKQGVEDAGSLVANSARFLTGNELPQEPTPAQDALRQKHQAGTADRHDYEAAFLEGMGNSPGGKLLGAMGGLIPEANIIGTTVQKWINPYVAKKTGADPNEINLAEMAALPVVGSKLRSMQNSGDLSASDLPSAKVAGTILPAASKVASAAISPLKSITSPVTNALLDVDNPLGGPGLKSAYQSPTAVEGIRLENNIPGLKLSAGELTGNTRARGIEDTLANTAKWGDKFAKANEDKINAIISKFNDTLGGIYGQETVPENFGAKLTDAYNGTLDSLKQTRREQAKVDFGAAYDNSDDDGRYIPTNNLFRTLQDLRDEGNARLLTDSKALGGKMANSLLSKLTVKTQKGNEMADNITIKELGNGLSDFGEDAANKDYPDATRRVYARVYGALQQDLDAEIANPHGDPQRIGMLTVARDNYKNLSDRMADIQKTTLGNMVGYADHNSQGQLTLSPETLANKFTSLQPSELRNTLKFLDDNHPDVANMGRRYVLESALRKAQEGVGMRGVGTSKPFAKADFVKSLGSPDRLNVLLGDSRAADDVTDVAAATNRLIDWGANKSGSQTFTRGNIFDTLYGFGKGALIKAAVSDNLANDLLDPSKRHRMGVEARQTQSFFDKMKSGGKDFMKDQSGAMVMDFGKAKQALQRMNPANQNLENGLPPVPKEELNPARIKEKLQWLRNNINPNEIKDWEDQEGKPLHKWDPIDIHDMHEATQPTLKDQ